jgi:hypothetical protein
VRPSSAPSTHSLVHLLNCLCMFARVQKRKNWRWGAQPSRCEPRVLFKATRILNCFRLNKFTWLSLTHSLVCNWLSFIQRADQILPLLNLCNATACHRTRGHCFCAQPDNPFWEMPVFVCFHPPVSFVLVCQTIRRKGQLAYLTHSVTHKLLGGF